MLERLNIKLAIPRQCEVNLLGQLRRTGKHCGRPPIAPKLAQAIRDALAVPGRPGFHKIRRSLRRGDWHGSADRPRLGSTLDLTADLKSSRRSACARG